MDFLFVDKPAGVTTHTSRNESEKGKLEFDPCDGFAEYLSARFDTSMLVAHRLDRGTTGSLVFARNKQAAEILRELFTSHRVKKTYLFLTDKKREDSKYGQEFEIESFIERQASIFVSLFPSAENPANARTRFRFLEESHGLSLWQAEPISGKPHQIRLHAKEAGLPVLGDTDHGGSPYPALCLHNYSLEFKINDKTHHHISPPPRWFKQRELCEDPFLSRWLAAIDRRERLVRSWQSFGEEEPQTLRWLHSESDPLRCEQMGDTFALSWFADDLPSPAERQSIEALAETLNWKKWYLQLRGNRGRSPLEERQIKSTESLPNRWIATENDLRFEFRSDTGLSPGLFLDQRQNRKWVRSHTIGKTVLNLFCYTGGFSVAAAKGGATKIVSVDVSKTFLEWAKVNFKLNALPTDGHEFRAIDSREYLNWAKKKGLLFDLIICDPPSFGRSKAGVFRIEKDLDSLTQLLLDVLAPNGQILLATNYESWSEVQLLNRLEKSGAQIQRTPLQDWDFELPNEARNMKSFFLAKNPKF